MEMCGELQAPAVFSLQRSQIPIRIGSCVSFRSGMEMCGELQAPAISLFRELQNP
jgi:hypothetical protein